MRPFFGIAALSTLVAALPAPLPQQIDLEFVIEQPDPTYTVDIIGLASQAITYDPGVIAAQVTEAVSAVSVDINDVATSTQIAKRDATPAACATLPSGASSIPVSESDSPAAFVASPLVASVALKAAAPSGYSLTFSNLTATALSYGYLGVSSLDSYDTQECSRRCEKASGCMSFNIYFERSPSLMPGPGCENPSSVTLIRCALWGGPLSPGTAQNNGTSVAAFKTVFAGSNGYVSKTIITPRGYSQPIDLGSSALNAPYDAAGYNTYMGFTMFTKGVFNISLCAAYCDAQTTYNLNHPPSDGTPVKTCHSFNTYMLYKNNPSLVQGQYCVIYSETWDKKYATNTGFSSYMCSNVSDAGPSPSIGDAVGAARQASKDISWSTLQPFCSSMLNIGSATSSVQTPAGLSKYPGSILTSACGLQGIGAQTTSRVQASSMTSLSQTGSTSSFATGPVNTASSVTSSGSQTSSSPFPTTRPTTLNAVEQGYYNSMSSALRYNSNKNIKGRLPSATQTVTIPAVAMEASDVSKQASLQGQLQRDNLTSFDDTVKSVANAMEQAFTTTTDSVADIEWDDGTSGSSISTMIPRFALPEPYTGPKELMKRDEFWDGFWEGFNLALCNDVVTTLLDQADFICKSVELGRAIYCIAQGGCPQPAPPPPVEYPFERNYQMTISPFQNTVVYRDSVSTLECKNCGMQISSFKITGSFIVNLQTATVVSSSLTFTQDSIQNFNWALTTTGNSDGSWSYIRGTEELGSIGASGIFSISPRVLYAVGASWSSSGPVQLTFGGSASLSGAYLQTDTTDLYNPSSSNWNPKLDIAQPKIVGSSASMIPFVKSSIEVDIQLFQKTTPRAIILTSEISLGSSTSYVNMAKLGRAPCKGGQLQSTTFTSVQNAAIIRGTNFKLFKQSGTTPVVCSDTIIPARAAADVAVFKSNAGAPAFCSSFIAYSPGTVSVTIIQTITVATSIATITGSGITTTTPSAVTETTTVTSSVSKNPQHLAKRSVSATSPATSLFAGHTLVARKVVPTPILLQTWLPQQVSSVCSAIATGKTSINITQSSVLSSGVTTSTVQSTVTAPASTITKTSTRYVPASTPYFVEGSAAAPVDYASGMGNWQTSGGATHTRWDYTRKINSLVTLRFPFFFAQMLLNTGSSREGTFSRQLTGLQPGWAYSLNLTAGFWSTTDTCTVTYKLDDFVIASYSPSNTGLMTQYKYGAVTYSQAQVEGNHAMRIPDGPIEVIPTKETQSLSITMSRTANGGFAEFGSVAFYGPTEPEA